MSKKSRTAAGAAVSHGDCVSAIRSGVFLVAFMLGFASACLWMNRMHKVMDAAHVCVCEEKACVHDVSPPTTTTTTMQAPTTESIARTLVPLSRTVINNATRDAYLRVLAGSITGYTADYAGRCGDFGECKVRKEFDATLRERGEDWPPFAETMCGLLRLRNIRTAIEDVIASRIDGDIVEFGVWRGGAMIFARGVLNAFEQTHRRVYCFDAFDAIAGYGGAVSFLNVKEAEVKHNFDKYGLLDNDKVQFEPGLFKNAIPRFVERNRAALQNQTLKFAIFRVDSNFYDSHADPFYAFYENVPVGGYVIFDDIYSHPPVRAFWDDFCRDQGIREKLIQVDKNCGYFKKTRAVKIDQSKRPAFRDANL